MVLKALLALTSRYKDYMMKKAPWYRPHLDPFYRMDDEQLLARCLYGEARGETYEGKLAVGCVIRNRVKEPRWWGNTYQRVILADKQFSCFNIDQINKAIPIMLNPKDKKNWDECREAARAVLNNCPDITLGANHYFADYIKPPVWVSRMAQTVKIGRHIFYDDRG